MQEISAYPILSYLVNWIVGHDTTSFHHHSSVWIPFALPATVISTYNGCQYGLYSSILFWWLFLCHSTYISYSCTYLRVIVRQVQNVPFSLFAYCFFFFSSILWPLSGSFVGLFNAIIGLHWLIVSIYLSCCVSVCLHVRLSVSLSVCVRQSVCASLSVCVSVYLTCCLCVCVYGALVTSSLLLLHFYSCECVWVYVCLCVCAHA